MSSNDILDLEGQIALVTGGGQGAGRAIALELACHNSGGIVVNDYVFERAVAVVKEIEAMGVKAYPIAFDVSKMDAVRAANDEAKQNIGAPTILVNNAGNAGPTDDPNFGDFFWNEDPSQWAKYLNTNLYGVMNCCHVFMKNMVEANRGRVVTIVSDAGRVGEARLAVYSAAKAGAAGLVRALAKESARWNITCNAIALSTLLPPLPPEQLEEYVSTDRAKKYVSNYVVRRFGRPEDVAAMATFLCSKGSSWITGQTYPVDGGYSFAL